MIVFSLTRLSFAVVVLLLAPLTACAAPSPSLTVMEFGGPNILFAADSVNGKIHAFELDRIPAETDSLDVQPYNLVDFGSSVAELFDVGPLDVTARCSRSIVDGDRSSI